MKSCKWIQNVRLCDPKPESSALVKCKSAVPKRYWFRVATHMHIPLSHSPPSLPPRCFSTIYGRGRKILSIRLFPSSTAGDSNRRRSYHRIRTRDARFAMISWRSSTDIGGHWITLCARLKNFQLIWNHCRRVYRTNIIQVLLKTESYYVGLGNRLGPFLHSEKLIWMFREQIRFRWGVQFLIPLYAPVTSHSFFLVLIENEKRKKKF